MGQSETTSREKVRTRGRDGHLAYNQFNNLLHPPLTANAGQNGQPKLKTHQRKQLKTRRPVKTHDGDGVHPKHGSSNNGTSGGTQRVSKLTTTGIVRTFPGQPTPKLLFVPTTLLFVPIMPLYVLVAEVNRCLRLGKDAFTASVSVARPATT